MKDTLNNLFHFDRSEWQSLIINYSIKIIVGILLLLIGFWIIKKITIFTGHILKRRLRDSTVSTFLRNFINVLLKLFCILFVLNVVGVKTTSLIAIIGAASLAIGLALQGTLTNFAGGIMLLLFRPFRVGDIIEAQGKKGIVKEIQMFSTIILTEENKRVVIPNNMLSNGIIEINPHGTFSKKVENRDRILQ